MSALFNGHRVEIGMFGGHEYVNKARTLGNFDDEDRDNFYSWLETDEVG